MEAPCSFSAFVRQQTVAGGDKPEEKNPLRLLVKMSSKQRQEGRSGRGREREGCGEQW